MEQNALSKKKGILLHLHIKTTHCYDYSARPVAGAAEGALAVVVGVTVVVSVVGAGVAVCANVSVAAAIAETAKTPVAITAFLII